MAKDVRGDLHLLGAGKVSFDRKDALTGLFTGELFLGNCPDFSAGITDDRKIKRSSATAARPIVADALVTRDFTFSVTLDEWDKRNVALGLMSDLVTLAQDAAADVAVTITAVKQGYWYQVRDADGNDVRKLTDVALATYAVITDFLVDLEGGRIFIVEGGTIADATDIDVTYTCAADTTEILNLGSANKVEGFMRFVGDPSLGPYYEAKLWHVSLQPDGDVGFIGEDYGEFKLKVTVKDDSANHPTFPLGQVIPRVGPEGVGDVATVI